MIENELFAQISSHRWELKLVHSHNLEKRENLIFISIIITEST
jgi:hypothetical protein